MNVLKSHKQLVEEGRIVFRPDPSIPGMGDWVPCDGGTYVRDAKSGELSLVGAPTSLAQLKKAKPTSKPTAKAPAPAVESDPTPKA